MKFKYRLVICSVLFAALGNTHGATEITDRGAAAQNIPVTPERLLVLCEGDRGAYWCDGFLSAAIVSLGIDSRNECLPKVEVNRFIHEGAWTLTLNWLIAQPSETEVTLFEAVKNALSERGCDI